jgi:DNA modification methylase
MSENRSHYQTGLPILETMQVDDKTANRKRNSKKRANELNGSTWTRYSISIWSDIKKTKEEIELGHPAIFPLALVSRLIQCFTNKDERVVLDPFVGIGSTAIAAEGMGKIGIGFEINDEFAEKARNRPCIQDMFGRCELGERKIYTGDSKELFSYIEYESVDFVVTSPPYWDILLQERTADNKEIRHYGEQLEDLGKIRDYHKFLKSLSDIFKLTYYAMKPGKYCCVIVMDIRKKDRFYPYHEDVAKFMQEIGFIFDDIIIWDRRPEYNNMRPLGFPTKFRINKAHEYILIFQKPNNKIEK